MENTENLGWLELDAWVTDRRYKQLYIRFAGDIYVCQVGKPPRADDSIFYEFNGKSIIGKFSDVKRQLPFELRIAASNGQIINQQIDAPKILGTITHKLIEL